MSDELDRNRFTAARFKQPQTGTQREQGVPGRVRPPAAGLVRLRGPIKEQDRVAFESCRAGDGQDTARAVEFSCRSIVVHVVIEQPGGLTGCRGQPALDGLGQGQKGSATTV